MWKMQSTIFVILLPPARILLHLKNCWRSVEDVPRNPNDKISWLISQTRLFELNQDLICDWNFVPYRTVSLSIVLYRWVPYCIVLYRTVSYSTVLYRYFILVPFNPGRDRYREQSPLPLPITECIQSYPLFSLPFQFWLWMNIECFERFVQVTKILLNDFSLLNR